VNIAVGVVVIVGVIGLALRTLGWLPEPRSMRYWRDRAEDAEKAYEARETEISELRATRTMEPILRLLQSNAQVQGQVLDRLVHHNGSFKHMEESFGEIHEALRLLTGFITGITDIPTREGQ
jgi:hypothetical protein